MRLQAEIESEIETLRAQYDNWNNVQNEGATDGYNPFEDGFESLSSELYECKKQKTEKEWTKEVTVKRQSWFNTQGFTSPLMALNSCRKQGWEWADLKSAVKRHA